VKNLAYIEARSEDESQIIRPLAEISIEANDEWCFRYF
jgi:hypothetical protein